MTSLAGPFRARMTPLTHNVQHGFDESRLLIVGAQVLVGFQSRAAFEPGCLGTMEQKTGLRGVVG
jgi:hypothetical protein